MPSCPILMLLRIGGRLARKRTGSGIGRLVNPLQHRRARKEDLSREESDRDVRLARLAALTEKIFGDAKQGMLWLRSAKKRFDGRTPVDMMATEAGSRLVEEALYQIDEGMAA